jgi:hypothetical protein
MGLSSPSRNARNRMFVRLRRVVSARSVHFVLPSVLTSALPTYTAALGIHSCS